jgi:hypothetical protein
VLDGNQLRGHRQQIGKSAALTEGQPQWIVVLSGHWWIESMDGTRVEQGPEEFSLGEDQGCSLTDGRKGHRSGKSAAGAGALGAVASDFRDFIERLNGIGACANANR